MALNQYIDFTLLRANASVAEIMTHCAKAVHHEFYAVCVPPCYVEYAHKRLKDTNVKVCSVVGFPLGYNTLETKIAEAKDLISKGADELDMVVNLAEVKNGNWFYIEEEIGQFVALCKRKEVISKIIIEVTTLSQAETIAICEICNRILPHFVKTSTGFAAGAKIGEEPYRVAWMREILLPEIQIKVSGGVSSPFQAMTFIEKHGVTRIGTSVNLMV